jgi:hypothetical protein
MKAVAAVFVLVGLAAAPAAAQNWRSHDASAQGARTWSSHGGGHSFNGQADRPGDFRCDAYWDRDRDDCHASWRDQRPLVRHYGSGYRTRGSGHAGGGYVYQPYNQGTQYWGAYGRPDQVYPGSGYGGHIGYQAGGGRDPRRTAWCASTYRSYDPGSGYYRAYSGRLIFCG